jgi:putative FmdB family regulatory protein
MPLYEYECDACHQRFEVIQKFSDPPPESCARCGKGPLRRLMSTPAIQFKGSGWYITDYAGGRSSAASSSASSESGEKSEKGDKGEKKDSAPAKTESTKSDSSSSASTTSTTKKE